MRVVAGLGNPGKDYEASLHNLGFRVVERLATLAGAGPWERKFDGLLAAVGQGDARVLLLKPQTFMNRSGRSVAALLRFYKVELAELLVIVDDLDLETGKVRLRDGGSDGGHRGLRSVIGECGSQNFK
ncbi:MAG: aminoacyl-tRNA hydrolase, partial [Candidatus Lambdaproteobacteria bacterium]|nr:aminoacyl-tRNA hydrolase [Candidatus Lambdaproteobacteria bacterium]